MRSWLFVPASSPRKLEKATATGADVLLLDLEDAVAPAEKQAAREAAAVYIASRDAGSRQQIYVRINGFDTGLADADLEAVGPAAPAGVMLPKCLSGRDVADLDNRLSVLEARNGLEAGGIAIAVIAGETAGSVFEMGGYRDCSPRLAALTWGSEDLAGDIGAREIRTGNGFTEPFALARSLALFGASAAGVAAIDTVFADFRDPDGLRAEARRAARDGFAGKLAIHPAQVPVINAAFTPTAEEVEMADRVIEAVEQGGGVAQVDGRMVDLAHVRQARRVLARAALAEDDEAE